jgi:hypothetical protein
VISFVIKTLEDFPPSFSVSSFDEPEEHPLKCGAAIIASTVVPVVFIKFLLFINQNSYKVSGKGKAGAARAGFLCSSKTVCWEARLMAR